MQLIEHAGGQTNDTLLGQTSTSAKVGGYILIVLGILELLVGLAKLATDFAPFYPDFLFAVVDTVTALIVIGAGWLGTKAKSPTKILTSLLLAVTAGIIGLSGFPVYGLESMTGIFGILYLLSAIPLFVAYRR